MLKKLFGPLAIAAILATTFAGAASAQGLVPMVCATIYGNGPILYRPVSWIGATCYVATPAGPVYGTFVAL
jgi:hypothetical protein